MPRSTVFYNDGCFHIFNRGTDKRDIFSDARDYERFILSMDLLNNTEDGLMIDWRDFKQSNPLATVDDFLKLRFRNREPLVEILAYCLNPNHYHLILKQVQEKGIEKFLHRLGVSHTKYYNHKHVRSGSLFQGVFKSIHIDSNEYLLHLSAYVNMNNFIHGYTGNEKWPYSSLPAYLGNKKDPLIKRGMILGQFSNTTDYATFLKNNAAYMKEKKALAKYLIEE